SLRICRHYFQYLLGMVPSPRLHRTYGQLCCREVGRHVQRLSTHSKTQYIHHWRCDWKNGRSISRRMIINKLSQGCKKTPALLTMICAMVAFNDKTYVMTSDKEKKNSFAFNRF